MNSLDGMQEPLRAALAEPLPGADAQASMSPRWLDPPPFRRPHGSLPQRGVPAGALLLLTARDHVPHIVLTVRSRELPKHAGQVSLPGGMQEEGEELLETALRETEEEIGVDPVRVEVLGALSPLFIPPTEFILHPFVGVYRSPFTPRLSAEVERVVEVPLEHMIRPESMMRESRVIRGSRAEVPFFLLGGEKVWGATAMVLAEFLAVVRRSRG